MAKKKHIFETRPAVTRTDFDNDVKELVAVERAQGIDAMKARFSHIVEERSLVNWEAHVLAERVAKELVGA